MSRILLAMRKATGAVIALAIVAACRPAGESPKASPGVAAGSTVSIPAEWSALGIPRKGLLRVSPETNAHGFYADYGAGTGPR